MNFSMVKISGSKQSDGAYKYESTIMEQGASTRWNNLFESEHELVSIMRSILARQKRERDVGHLLRGIHEGEYYLFDVDLSKEQAELLGWKRTEEIELLTEA